LRFERPRSQLTEPSSIGTRRKSQKVDGIAIRFWIRKVEKDNLVRVTPILDRLRIILAGDFILQPISDGDRERVWVSLVLRPISISQWHCRLDRSIVEKSIKKRVVKARNALEAGDSGCDFLLLEFPLLASSLLPACYILLLVSSRCYPIAESP
jgi:hypothetical protein